MIWVERLCKMIMGFCRCNYYYKWFTWATIILNLIFVYVICPKRWIIARIRPAWRMEREETFPVFSLKFRAPLIILLKRMHTGTRRYLTQTKNVIVAVDFFTSEVNWRNSKSESLLNWAAFVNAFFTCCLRKWRGNYLTSELVEFCPPILISIRNVRVDK